MAAGRFSKRNAATVNRRPQALHDAHASAWIWSEQRAYATGYIAAIDGQVVRRGGVE